MKVPKCLKCGKQLLVEYNDKPNYSTYGDKNLSRRWICKHCGYIGHWHLVSTKAV